MSEVGSRILNSLVSVGGRTLIEALVRWLLGANQLPKPMQTYQLFDDSFRHILKSILLKSVIIVQEN